MIVFLGVVDAFTVVGWSNTSGPTSGFHAFLYSDGVMVDLNTLLPPGSGWSLTTATAINDSGQIAGCGVAPDGHIEAYLLSPSSPSPTIVLDSLSTTDSRSVTIQYDVNNASIPHAVDIGIFRSPTPTYDPAHSHRIDSIQGPGETGHWSLTVLVDHPIGPAFKYHYVVAVADPNGTLSGVTIDNSAGEFRTYVISAVSVGFDLRTIIRYPFDPQAWVTKMATSLHTAGYDRSIPFGWDSGAPIAHLIVDAGHDLFKQLAFHVVQAASQQLQPNDVIDIHLIGHSRGAVVVTEAMTELLDTIHVPQLQHGYMKLTLLDPHPANLDYGLNASINPLVDTLVVPAYVAFEIAVHDPPICVPPRVDELEVFWQKTSFIHLSGMEFWLNLQGIDPSQITFDGSRTRLVEHDLTGLYGHSSLHDYYQFVYIPGG